jgi:hypothetical protein
MTERYGERTKSGRRGYGGGLPFGKAALPMRFVAGNPGRIKLDTLEVIGHFFCTNTHLEKSDHGQHD